MDCQRRIETFRIERQFHELTRNMKEIKEDTKKLHEFSFYNYLMNWSTSIFCVFAGAAVGYALASDTGVGIEYQITLIVAIVMSLIISIPAILLKRFGKIH